jgi:predicted NAD-dependent protein-ADP-ribosyltransferase YbiA (DUF1768 family)
LPYYKLSNFYAADIEYKGSMYASTEHAFQAAKVLDPEEARKLTTSGALGGLTEEAVATLGVKVNYWGKKNMVGIVPKMFIKRLPFIHKRSFDERECEAIFTELLLLKYRTHADLKSVLLDTGDAYLLEFDRSARRRFDKDSNDVVRWAGMVVDGRVIGHNQMGALMMKVREVLRAEVA